MDEPWTIELIFDSLGNPDLQRGFLDEINRAPAGQLMTVFTRWSAVAEQLTAAISRGRQLAAAEERGEQLPADLIDMTEQVMAEARRIRHQHGAA